MTKGDKTLFNIREEGEKMERTTPLWGVEGESVCNKTLVSFVMRMQQK